MRSFIISWILIGFLTVPTHFTFGRELCPWNTYQLWNYLTKLVTRKRRSLCDKIKLRCWEITILYLALWILRKLLLLLISWISFFITESRQILVIIHIQEIVDRILNFILARFGFWKSMIKWMSSFFAWKSWVSWRREVMLDQWWWSLINLIKLILYVGDLRLNRIWNWHQSFSEEVAGSLDSAFVWLLFQSYLRFVCLKNVWIF